MHQHKRIFPLWPYLEGVIFVAIVAAVDYWVFPATYAFRGMPFNLLWLPIFLIAGRYGTMPGVLTGLLAACYYFYAISIENLFYGNFEYGLSDKIQVFSFLFFGAMFGQMYDRILNKYLSLMSDHEDLTEQNNNLYAHYEVLESTNEELEKRLIRRHVTINNLYDMAKNLESLEEQALYKGISELMTNFLQAQKGCIYFLDDKNVFVPVYAFGYMEDEKAHLAGKITTNSLIKKALEGDKPISFRHGFDVQFNLSVNDKCLIAAPVYLAVENKVVGLLTVDEAPFLALNASNVRILGIIADWVANAVQKNKYVGKLKEKEIDDSLSRTFSYTFFKARLSEEASRFMRSDTPFTVALMKMCDFENFTKESQNSVLKEMGEIFKCSIRFHDIICRYNIDGVFAFIFPLADESDGVFHINRLLKNIEAEKIKPYSDARVLETKMVIQTVRDNQPMRLYRLKPDVAASMIEDHINGLLNNNHNNNNNENS